MAYIGRQLARGENKLFDDISSSFNGSTTTFNLTVSSVATATATPYQLFVSLGGVMQKPNTDFTTAGNQITFTTAPAAGLSCWIMMQGDTIDNAAVADASITPSKISGSNFAFSGDLRLKDADGSHYVGFASPTTVASNKVWTLPAADGSASQYLQTNGSGVLSWATVSIGGGTGIDFNDNVKARWGTGNDLEIFHNASNSVINDAGTGDLLLQVGGATKATVSSTGFGVTGALTVSTNATISGNLTVSGTTTTVDSVTLSVKDKNIEMGVVSSPSDTTADGGGITLKGASDKSFNWVNATDAWTSSEHIHLLDDKRLFVGGASGTTDGLEIYHASNHSYIQDTGTGALKIRGDDVRLETSAGNNILKLNGNVAELFHTGNKKLETTSGGINVTGAINVNGSALSTAPQITATADGAITAGDTVIVKTDGDVKKVGLSITVANPPTVTSTRSQLTGDSIMRPEALYIPSIGKIVTAFENASSGDDLEFIVGEISDGGGFTWGSIVQADSEHLASTPGLVYDTSTNKLVALYYETGNTKVYAIVGTISGNSISFGTKVLVWNSDSGQYATSLCFDSTNNKVVAVYRAGGSNNPRSRVGTVSGTSTSWGTEAALDTYECDQIDTCYDPDTERVIAICRDANNNIVKSYVGTVSGTNISWGSAVNVATQGTTNRIAYDTENNRVVASYQNNSSNSAVKVGTVTGSSTNSISWGSEVVWYSANSSNGQKIEFDPYTKRIVTTTLNTNDMKIYIASGAVSGSSITFGSAAIAEDTVNYGTSTIALTIAQKGQAITFTRIPSLSQDYYATRSVIGTGTTNMTTENYIGIAASTVSDNATATIDVSGATNSSQSSLTAGQKYYVQSDGSLGLTADTPEVFAGTAISATKIIVNDQQTIPTVPLTEVDQWGLWGTSVHGSNWNTNVFGSGGNYGTLTRNSWCGMPIGTGVTNTNGVFTFPSTGKWEITVKWNIRRYNVNVGFTITGRYSSDSGSNWSDIDIVTHGPGTGTTGYNGSGISQIVLNVTNASTFQLRFEGDAGNNPYWIRESTNLLFKKLN